MSPDAPGWAAFSRHIARVTGMFRTAIRPYTEAARSIAVQRTAAEETAKALAERPKRELRELTVVTVRCPGNELLLRVVRIPEDRQPIRADGESLRWESGRAGKVHGGAGRGRCAWRPVKPIWRRAFCVGSPLTASSGAWSRAILAALESAA